MKQCVIRVQAKFLMTFLLLLGGLCTLAEAKWATREDSLLEKEFENTQIYVYKDGRTTHTYEVQALLLRDGVRNSLSPTRLAYRSSLEALKIVEAKTILDGVEYPVSSSQIEDKPASSQKRGFDQINQVTIAFPNLKVGSRIYLKYIIETKIPSFPGFFGYEYIAGSDVLGVGEVYSLKETLDIQSELPLNYRITDSRDLMRVREKPEDKNLPYSIHVETQQPFTTVVIHELNGVPSPGSYPVITLSSLKENEWDKFANLYLSKIEQILAEPLPELFQLILKEAERKASLEDKINEVTSLLGEKVTYFGNWSTLNGAYVPRSLQEIANQSQADCKDYAAVTIAILRKLGIKADMAWVMKSLLPFRPAHSTLPYPRVNHAIVRVQDGDRVLWIDPTEFESFAQGIFPGISDREALVFDIQQPRLDFIPPIRPESAVIRSSLTLDLIDSHKVFAERQVEYKGAESLYFTGMSLNATQEDVQEELLKGICSREKIYGEKFPDLDWSSRVVKDLRCSFSCFLENPFSRTTAGLAYFPHTPLRLKYKNLLIKTKDRVSDLVADEYPSTVMREFHFKKSGNLKPFVAEDQRKSILSTPWVDAFQTIEDRGDEVVVTESLAIKMAVIPNSVLHTAEFAQFQKDLDERLEPVGVVCVDRK